MTSLTLSPAVFVDALVQNGWRLGPNCHLFVEPETPLETLHAFAQDVGLRREWFQHKPGKLPHYDLTKRRRGIALAIGAVELDRRLTVTIIRRWREMQSSIPNP